MSDLTDRMRTCAAYLAAIDGESAMFENALRDAADLLLAASNTLEEYDARWPAGPKVGLGEPMEIIEPMTQSEAIQRRVVPVEGPFDVPKATWIADAGDLPAVPTGKPSPRPNRVCPECDSRANKRVFRRDGKMMLACPACACTWEYQP